MADQVAVEDLPFFTERMAVIRRARHGGIAQPGDDHKARDPTTELVMKWEIVQKMITDRRRDTFGCAVLTATGKVKVADPVALDALLSEIGEFEAQLSELEAAIRKLDELGTKYLYQLEGVAYALLGTVPQAKRVLDNKIDLARRRHYKLEIQDVLKLPEVVDAQKVFDDTKKQNEKNSKEIREEIEAVRSVLAGVGA